jgi:hypothetical protein
LRYAAKNERSCPYKPFQPGVRLREPRDECASGMAREQEIGDGLSAKTAVGPLKRHTTVIGASAKRIISLTSLVA